MHVPKSLCGQFLERSLELEVELPLRPYSDLPKVTFESHAAGCGALRSISAKSKIPMVSIVSRGLHQMYFMCLMPGDRSDPSKMPTSNDSDPLHEVA